jgi:Domain of unknown function (DUF4431)
MKILLCLIIYFFLTFHSIAQPKEINYNKFTYLTGTIFEQDGIDCCSNGEARDISFPHLLLDNPLNISAKDKATAELDEPLKSDVKIVQLIIPLNQTKNYNRLKGKRVKILCLPFGAFNGHHITDILCEVKLIKER